MRCWNWSWKSRKSGNSMSSKAIILWLEKKLIDKGIEQVPNLYRCRTSKIKNKNIQEH